MPLQKMTVDFPILMAMNTQLMQLFSLNAESHSFGIQQNVVEEQNAMRRGFVYSMPVYQRDEA